MEYLDITSSHKNILRGSIFLLLLVIAQRSSGFASTDRGLMLRISAKK